MIIFDREIAVLPLDVEQSGAGAQLVRGSGMVTALLALFESIWASARPVGEPRRAAPVELSDTEGEILRILATGATDEVVARQLGVSVRTVRRLTAALMTRYEAQSRFELGVKLGQMGWGHGAGPARRTGTA
jgi:DNA-binding NarL/FixJ family response regulator